MNSNTMLTFQKHENSANSLVLIQKEREDYLIRDYQFKLKGSFNGLGIRYLHYHEKDHTLLISNIIDGRVHLLNLSTGSLKNFCNHTTTVRKIQVFENEIITAGWDGSVGVSNYHTLEQRLKLTDKAMGRCPDFKLSDDGKYLFSFSYDSDKQPGVMGNNVRKWSLEDGKLHFVSPASGEQQRIGRSGSIIVHQNLLRVCSDNGYFRVLDMHSGRLIKEVKSDTDFRSMTALLAHNYLLAADWLGYLYCFNLKNHELEFKMKCHNADILCVRVHPKNPDIIFSASTDGTVKIWEIPGFDLINTISINQYSAWSMVFINDRLAVSDTAGEIRIYDINDLNNIRFLGRIVISDQSFVAQMTGSKLFFTNDLSSMEVFREPDETKITGKEAEYLLGQSNKLMVLRELLGIEDSFTDLLSCPTNVTQLLPESF